MNRRQYLAATGVVLATILTGCSGSTDAEEESNSSTNAGGESDNSPDGKEESANLIESGEVGTGSDDHFVEVESGDTIRVVVTNEDDRGSSGVDILNPDNEEVLQERDIKNKKTVTYEAETTGEFQIIIKTGWTASYETYVE